MYFHLDSVIQRTSLKDSHNAVHGFRPSVAGTSRHYQDSIFSRGAAPRICHAARGGADYGKYICPFPTSRQRGVALLRLHSKKGCPLTLPHSKGGG